ncbi:MAG: APC family permease, partial [Clostridia bacterium]|nr:APC family permease [Clostridia bacterium]
LPFAGSVDVWTTNAFGHKVGFTTQWMMFLVQVVEPAMMAFIFITAAGHFFPNLVIPPIVQMFIAIGTALLWYIISNFNIDILGKLANIFFFAMIVMSLIVSISLFTSGHWSVDNLTAAKEAGAPTGLFPKGFGGIFLAMAAFSLKFIGFEMTPSMIEETTFPRSKMWKVILSALIVPAILYLLVVFAIGGMAPYDVIAGMSMPEPELVKMYDMASILGYIAVISGVLHAFTTLMGFWTSSARVLYGAAEMKQLPKSFRKLNKHGQPVLANTIVFLFTAFFCVFTAFSETSWVSFVYSMSNVAAGFVYFMCCLSFLVLRKKHPDWKRPYKLPCATFFSICGMLISLWVIVGSCMMMDMGGWIAFVIFCAVGIALYAGMTVYRKKNGEELKTFTPADIVEE